MSAPGGRDAQAVSAPGGRDAQAVSAPFDRVAVLGLGLLGGSVARAVRSRGVAARVVGATRRIDAYVNKGLERGKLTSQQADGVRTRLVTSLDYSAIAHCDWVLEAATENLELKRTIFSQVESMVSSRSRSRP